MATAGGGGAVLTGGRDRTGAPGAVTGGCDRPPGLRVRWPVAGGVGSAGQASVKTSPFSAFATSSAGGVKRSP